MYQKNRAWVEIDLENLKNNIRQFRKILPPDCELMPAVKANAYGHGAVPVSLELQKNKVENFCVASAEEGIELREAGIKGQILILGYTHPRLFPELCAYKLTQTVVDEKYARVLDQSGKKLSVHVGIDTGMHRLGERSTDTEKILNMWNLKNVRITGVYSHLCVSDGSTEEERAFTQRQIKRYDELIRTLHYAGITGFQTHLQGSYGVMNYSDLHYDLARVGIALYGTLSSPEDVVRSRIHLEPVLSLKARIECIHLLHSGERVGYGLTYTAQKEMKIAVVSIGYADGIPRQLSNKGYALVNGQKAALIGRVCMDQLFLDVTNISPINPGDEVVFIGESGEKKISADRIANWAGTISNEFLSRLGARLPRVTILKT